MKMSAPLNAGNHQIHALVNHEKQPNRFQCLRLLFGCIPETVSDTGAITAQSPQSMEKATSTEHLLCGIVNSSSLGSGLLDATDLRSLAQTSKGLNKAIDVLKDDTRSELMDYFDLSTEESPEFIEKSLLDAPWIRSKSNNELEEFILGAFGPERDLAANLFLQRLNVNTDQNTMQTIEPERKKLVNKLIDSNLGIGALRAFHDNGFDKEISEHEIVRLFVNACKNGSESIKFLLNKGMIKFLDNPRVSQMIFREVAGDEKALAQLETELPDFLSRIQFSDRLWTLGMALSDSKTTIKTIDSMLKLFDHNTFDRGVRCWILGSAACSGNVERIKVFLDSNYAKDFHTAASHWVLDCATRSGKYDVVNLLIKRLFGDNMSSSERRKFHIKTNSYQENTRHSDHLGGDNFPLLRPLPARKLVNLAMARLTVSGQEITEASVRREAEQHLRERRNAINPAFQ